MIKTSISIDFEKNKYWIIALYLNISLVLRMINLLCRVIFRTDFPYLNNTMWGIMVLPLVYYFINIAKRLRKIHFVVFAIWIIVILCAIVIHKLPDFLYRQALSDGISHVIVPIFMMLELKDTDKLVESLKPYVVIGLIVCALQIIVPYKNYYEYFSFAYITLIPALLSLCLAMLGDKKYMITYSLFLLSNILWGARGFILCSIVAFVLMMFCLKLSRKTMILVVLIAFVLLFIFIFSDQIISLLSSIFPNSRSIQFLVGEKNDNARYDIWRTLMGSFMDSPFSIRGIMSDRVALANKYSVSNESLVAGYYSHNFAVEIIYEFGLIGVIIIICLAYLITKTINAIKRKQNTSQIAVFVAFSAYFLGKLSVSSSYLIDISSGFFIGILLCYAGIGRFNLLNESKK